MKKTLFFSAIYFILFTIFEPVHAAGDQLKVLWDHDPAFGLGATEYHLYQVDATADPLPSIDQGVLTVVVPTVGSTTHSIVLPYPNTPTIFGVAAANATIEGPISATALFTPGLDTPTALRFQIVSPTTP